MADLADTQEAILLKLKQKGPQTAKALAEMLGITTMGVRQHLAILEEKALVAEGEEQKRQRGRPTRPWRLTEKAQGRFADGHSQISVELIASVREIFGPAGLDQLIGRRTAETYKLYEEALSQSRSVAARLKKLASLRSGEGYMAEVEKVGPNEWLLIENHCPICAAATACQGFCRSELEVFQKLFKGLAQVERSEHILKGARRCVYRVWAAGT